jgi:hypothetical protein
MTLSKRAGERPQAAATRRLIPAIDVQRGRATFAHAMLPAYEQDAGPLTTRELARTRRLAKKTFPKGKVLLVSSLF